MNLSKLTVPCKVYGLQQHVTSAPSLYLQLSQDAPLETLPSVTSLFLSHAQEASLSSSHILIVLFLVGIN